MDSGNPFDRLVVFGQVLGAALGIALVIAIVMACVKRSRGWVTVVSVMGGVVLLGAVAYFAGSRLSDGGASHAVATSDGVFEITVPGHWKHLPKVKDMAPDADFAVGNLVREEYMTVIVEPKADALLSLDLLSDAQGEQMKSKVTLGALTGPVKLKIGDYDAIQRELSGRLEGLDIVWLLTIIETEDTWFQVIGWTLERNRAAAMKELKETAATLKRIKPVSPRKAGGTEIEPAGKEGAPAFASDPGDRKSAPAKAGKRIAPDPAARDARVLALVTDVLGRTDVLPGKSLADELGADELARVEIVMAVEEEFDVSISDDAAAGFKTAADIQNWLTANIPGEIKAPETSPVPERSEESGK